MPLISGIFGGTAMLVGAATAVQSKGRTSVDLADRDAVLNAWLNEQSRLDSLGAITSQSRPQSRRGSSENSMSRFLSVIVEEPKPHKGDTNHGKSKQ